MIEIIDIDLGSSGKQEAHFQLEECLRNGYQVIGHGFYVNENRAPWERYTLYKVDSALKAESEAGNEQ